MKTIQSNLVCVEAMTYVVTIRMSYSPTVLQILYNVDLWLVANQLKVSTGTRSGTRSRMLQFEAMHVSLLGMSHRVQSPLPTVVAVQKAC